ncbi:MAG: hypothetical protein BZ133_01400 [Methanosphaera sp. SHI613]|jgi:hypothetical protein|nr:MAG: hypothetical protein BZ133_01400 [Methanosphaera sp. SHI613]
MINEEIIYNYVENHKNINEDDIINMIYYDSPVSINKEQIKNILTHLVDENRLIVRENNGIIKYSTNN